MESSNCEFVEINFKQKKKNVYKYDLIVSEKHVETHFYFAVVGIQILFFSSLSIEK